MSEQITRQIEGVCTSVSQRPDSNWTEYEIDIGRQYPVKLSTSKDDVKEMIRGVGTQRAVWTFSESDGNPNPHRPGTFYKNRWVFKAEAGGTLDPSLAQQPGQQTLSNAPAGGGVSGGQMPRIRRSRRIHRAAGDPEVGISRFPTCSRARTRHDQFFAFLDRLDDWMGRERKAEKATEEATPAGQTTTPDAPPENDDSDIPF